MTVAITGSDNFNRADNTALGSDWTQNRGNHDVHGTRLKTATIATGLSHAAFTGTSPASADYYVRAVKRGGGTGAHVLGVGARQKSASFGSFDAYTAELDLGTSWLYLRRYKGGVQTTLAFEVVTLASGVDYLLELRVAGTGATVALTALLDGEPIITYDDTSSDRITAANYAGVYDTVQSASGSNRVETDDFEFGTVAEQVATDRALPWHTQAGVATDRALPWHTRASLTAPDRALTWQTLAGLADQRALVWQTAAGVDDARTLTWHVAGPATADLALAWHTAAAVATDRELAWAVAVAVTVDWSAVWHVQVDAATATVDLGLLWPVAAAVATDRGLVWHTVATVADERALVWRVAVPLAVDQALAWHVMTPLTADVLALAWQVADEVAPADLVLAWQVAGEVAPADLALVWQVGRPGGSLATTPVAAWRERAPVGAWG